MTTCTVTITLDLPDSAGALLATGAIVPHVLDAVQDAANAVQGTDLPYTIDVTMTDDLTGTISGA